MALTFTVPTPETPGFLRRLRSAAHFSEQVQAGKLTAALVDELVGFLAEYVTGMSQDEAKGALMDASQQQFIAMLNAIMGVGDNPDPLAKKP